MTRVNVLAGPLGAGKTTTLLHLLANRPDERIAVIVNDFGTARIDDAVVSTSRSGLKIAEIAGGCVCCTAPENFGATLAALLDEVKPHRVLVEPTGLAHPADLLDILRRGPWAARIQVDATILVVDTRRPEGLHERVESADVVVANFDDLATDADRERLAAELARAWPAPEVVRATRGAVDPGILDRPAGKVRDHHHDHGDDPGHTEGWSVISPSWPIDAVFGRDALLAAFGASRIERAKGLFRTDEGAMLVEIAGGGVHARPSGWRGDSRADLIGTDRSALDALRGAIDAARLSADALRGLSDGLEIVEFGVRRQIPRGSLESLPGRIDDVSTRVPKRVGTAIPLSALIELRGTVAVIASDGLATAPVPAESLRDALLVYRLGDGPLPDAQGGPIRMLVPGSSVACANVKGVVRIVVR